MELKKQIDEFVEKFGRYEVFIKKEGQLIQDVVYLESELKSLIENVAKKQRWAASLWIEDSSILEMPLISEQLFNN